MEKSERNQEVVGCPDCRQKILVIQSRVELLAIEEAVVFVRKGDKLTDIAILSHEPRKTFGVFKGNKCVFLSMKDKA